MAVTITAKGQITIPLRIRKRFNLNVGDQLEFDESAPVLTARRVINRDEWECAVSEWRKSTDAALKNHPWENQSSAEMIDDFRGGAVDEPGEPKAAS